MKSCSVCGKRAVYFQRHSNRHLCRKHFIYDFEKRVKYAVKKYGMIQKNDRIAIALSGGKDSTALTFVLKKLYGKRRDLEFFAITVDEGIAGYRPPTVEIAKKVTEMLEIPHYIISFKEEFGMDLDEMVKIGNKKPCSYCGVFRKYLLNRTARELNATKLATGHNLDDETQTILLNFMQGDIERLARLIPQRVQENLVVRIKPFREIYEKEVMLYCILNGIEVDMNECPYSRFPVRAVIRDFLYEFENRYPGRKFSVMRSFEALQDCFKANFPQKDLNRCEICGEPTPKQICQACVLRKELGIL
ncbi:TIGR00269 family protein [Archaeoglobus sulfaticallidus PM70-1]|uniref:TIGR00269 family protein n=1 Tax=Archaeoglobus sulfaticallidus PM70-1 TaxID=387631 RepID=N0BEV8_9EURY|nr:TIGR00269 family protein [Archaeoglobus sulfaticallidus]AGK61523.1 TIGR00269 family protein [Archaeoglobus sulfaticallidus PM70-1]